MRTSGLVERIARRLRRPGRPVPPSPYVPPRVELVYWRSSKGVNFGDYLSSAVVTRMLARRELLPDEAVPRAARLLAIGSILHFARSGDVVWGSGVNGKIDARAHAFDALDVRAVRGPLTQRFLAARGVACPSVFGDPGLLVPHLFPGRFGGVERRRPVAFVPNLHDIEAMAGWENVVSPLAHWAAVIRDIAAAEHVVSSSLHGLVIADAFGIPSTYLRLSETEAMFKYEDYAFGVGRGTLHVARTKGEAVRETPMEPPRFDPSALCAAFPYDLWGR